MTLPASGEIDFQEINSEFGVGLTNQRTILDAQVIQLAAGSAGSHGGVISIWDLYGHSWIITYSYPNPGTYYIQVPYSTNASVQLYGGAAGGGGGGMGGSGDGTDQGRDNGGNGGAGGGGGGDGQLWNGLIGFASGALLEVNIGSGGPGGTPGQSRQCNGNGAWGSGNNGGTWCGGEPGYAGGAGGQSWINANGSRVVTIDCGYPGQGGMGGYAGYGTTSTGGAGGGGYPAGAAGQNNYFAVGASLYSGVSAQINTFVFTGYNTDGTPAGYYTPSSPTKPAGLQNDGRPALSPGAGGAGGNGRGGAGGAASPRLSGAGSPGGAGAGGYGTVSINNPAILGGNGPGYSGGPGPVGYPTYVYYVNNTAQYNSYIKNGSTGPATCYLAGSLVMMADGSWKEIQNVVAGDMLMTPVGPKECKYLHTTLLGPCRQVMTFEEDPSLGMVVDHLLWSRQEGRQNWWCGDIPQLHREILSGFGTNRKNINDFFEGEVEYAHISGFVKRTPKPLPDVHPETMVYLPCLDGPPGIVNGYLTTFFINEEQFDYQSLDWDRVHPMLSKHNAHLQLLLAEREKQLPGNVQA